jgi:hypothetical protein
MISSNDLIVGGPLFVLATKAGYEVINNRAQTVLEITGDGDWKQLEKACHKFVMQWHNGHQYDHVTIVMRHGDGTRDLRDVGVNSIRFAILPPVNVGPHRDYGGCGIMGAHESNGRWRCQMTVHGKRIYLGMYNTKHEAGAARDRYVVEHGLTVPLNFPQEELAIA